MRNLQHKVLQSVCTVVAVAALALMGFVQPALALDVDGTDYYGNGAIDTTSQTPSIDVLSVGGKSGETLYLRVQQDGQTIADRLSYSLGGSSASSRGGVVSLNIAGLTLDGSKTYTVTAYADREETQELYTGTIYAVYAQLDDTSSVLVGAHTVASGEAADTYMPSEKLFINNTNYALNAETPVAVEGTKLTYAYESYDAAASVDGTITYVDTKGNVISSTTVSGITSSNPKTVSIPAMVSTTVDGTTYYYRTVYFKDSVVLSTPGNLSYTITCKYMGEDAAAQNKYYKARVSMVDENGSAIATDTVSVTGTYYYTLPSTIYKRVSGTLYIYELQGAQVLTFSVADNAEGKDEIVYTASYSTRKIEEQGINVTYNLIDGTKGIGEEGRVLGTTTTTVSSDNTTASPVDKIDVNGTTYVLANDVSNYTYTYGSNANPSIDVYYLPEGYTPSHGSYEVTFNYVNFLTKETIKSFTFTSKESDNKDQEFESEESFSQDGVDYVRLAGQEDPIQHSYYSGIQTYTIYYRDVNDTYTSGTVINTIRVVYVDGTTNTTTEDETTASGQTGDATTAAEATAGQLNAGGTYSVADGEGNNSTLTNEAGVDSNTERIDDDETPLAQAPGSGGVSPVAIGAGAAGLAALAACLFYFFKKRNNNDDDQQSA